MKLNKKSFSTWLILLVFVLIPIGTVLATEYSDNFDTNPYSGSWTNEMSSAVWDSTNGELDISNDGDTAIRYSQNSPGSIDHEAQVTVLAVTSERLVGPGVRFDNSGQNDMYGVSFEGGTINIYRWNNGARTQLASVSSGVSFTVGNYYSIRLAASGGVGNSVVLNAWVSDHGSSKPSDPGWIGADGSPAVSFTDSSASGTRLDGSQNSHAGIAGRPTVIQNDNRHDYFKARAISDRGGVVTPPPPTPPSDTTPPSISSISVSNITTTGATITYTTNESVTSQVQYGLTTSYGSTQSSGGTTSHSVTLSNLTPNTAYSYRISATDSASNNTLSTNQTFTTSAVVVTPPPTTPTTPPVTTPTTPPAGTPTPTGTGKYLYVSPTGNDSVTYANNNASNPWRTIGRATWGSVNRSASNSAEAAKAGDVVLISGGTYDSTEVVNGRFGSVYNPVNQGTAGNYITFVCSGDCTLTAPNANSPIIGASGRSYIKWYANVSEGNSWVINACGMQSGCPNGTVNTTPDTGPVVCHDGTGCHIEGAVIDGTTPVDYTDNWNGIRAENAPSSVIRNNIIRNFRTQSGSRNASGVTLYGSANTIIENNQISNVAGGIYFKHNGSSSLPMTNVRARYNSISNTGQCASWSIGVGSNHFYQNICTDSSFGTLITGNGLLNDWIFNNTFYNISAGGVYLSTSGTGGRFWNNVCVNCASVISNEAGPMTAESVMDFEHNIYRNFSNFYSGVGGNQTFSAFKSAYPAFEQSAPASMDADPMFVSSTNFRLQSNSPARTLGVDILDLDGDGSTTDIIPAGAYVTGSEVIGLNTGGVVTNPQPVTPPTIPTAPTTPTTPPSTPSGGGSSPAPTTSTPSTGSGAGGAPSSGVSLPTTPTQPSTPTTNIPKPTLTRTVYVGSKGSDVTSLQTFLISTGYLAPNLNTGYYGNQTKLAVQKYQCATLKLCSGSETTNGYGVVGAKTRATFTTTPTTSQTTTTLSTEQRAVIQKQINDLLALVQQLMIQLKASQGN